MAMNADGTVGQLTIGAPAPTLFFANLRNECTGPTVHVATSKASNDEAIFAALADLRHNFALVNASATATAAQVQHGWEATMVQLFGGATQFRPPSGTLVVRAAALHIATSRCVVFSSGSACLLSRVPMPKIIMHY